MKQILLIVAIIAASILAGCSKTQSVSGTYTLQDKPKNELTLTQDGRFLLTYGTSASDSGSYTVEGNVIIVTAPMFGGAKGEIKNGTLVFPKVSEDDLVGSSFGGTWLRQNGTGKAVPTPKK